jgi:hypothetical protein
MYDCCGVDIEVKIGKTAIELQHRIEKSDISGAK